MTRREYWVADEEMDRLRRLCKRLDKYELDIVYAALKLYEDALDAVDAGNSRWASMEMVHGSDVDFEEQD